MFVNHIPSGGCRGTERLVTNNLEDIKEHLREYFSDDSSNLGILLCYGQELKIKTFLDGHKINEIDLHPCIQVIVKGFQPEINRFDDEYIEGESCRKKGYEYLRFSFDKNYETQGFDFKGDPLPESFYEIYLNDCSNGDSLSIELGSGNLNTETNMDWGKMSIPELNGNILEIGKTAIYFKNDQKKKANYGYEFNG